MLSELFCVVHMFLEFCSIFECGVCESYLT